jgi:hypothetical protein
MRLDFIYLKLEGLDWMFEQCFVLTAK